MAGIIDEVIAGMIAGIVAADMDLIAGERRDAEVVWHERFLSLKAGAR